MSTPLYKQDHQSANQDNIFYCGRTIWPNEEWWQSQYERLGLEHTYWVIATDRKNAQCVDCRNHAKAHRGRHYNPDRGYYESPEREAQAVSLDGLARLVKVMVNNEESL